MIILNFKLINLETMCPYKIGTLIWIMLMPSLLTSIHNLKVVWIGIPPIRQLTPKEVKLKNKPWITSDISKIIKIGN